MHLPDHFLTLVTFLKVLSFYFSFGSRIDDLTIGNSDKPSGLVEVESTDVTVGCVQHLFFVFETSQLLRSPGLLCLVVDLLLFANRALQLNRAGVINLLKRVDGAVPDSVDMDSLVLVEVSAAHIAVKRDYVRVRAVLSFHDVEAVGHDVAVLGSPVEELDLLNSDEAAQVVDLSPRVVAISLKPGEVKQLRSIVHFFPESLLHPLFGLSQVLVDLEVVEVRQDSHHVRHAVVVQQTQELERLHFKANRSIDEQQSQISDLGDIHHGLHVGGTLEERDSLVAVGSQRDGAFDARHFLLREVVHERLDQR